MSVRAGLRVALVAVYEYGVVPAATLFALVSTVIMGAFSFKGTRYLLMGTVPTPETITRITGVELAMSALFAIGGFVVAYVVKDLKHQRKMAPRET